MPTTVIVHCKSKVLIVGFVRVAITRRSKQRQPQTFSMSRVAEEALRADEEIDLNVACTDHIILAQIIELHHDFRLLISPIAPNPPCQHVQPA
jgi:hypothetical protein